MSANFEESAVATGLEKVSFHYNPKKGSVKECSKYYTSELILHASKVMLKILQARLQQYVSWELPDVHAGFMKGTIDLIANIHWIIEKVWEFQKNFYFWFIDYTKTFDCVDCNKLENSWEMGIPDHLTCLLRSLYTSQEAIVTTLHGKTDWFQIGEEVGQGCILSSCLFNLRSVFMCVKSIQSCLTLCDPMDYSL